MTTSEQASSGRSTTAAAMDGDMAAVQALWQEHRRWIAAVILAHKPQFADLEDLLQEVAMTLVTKINTLREESNLRAWLRAVAVNTARAAGRSERSRPATRGSAADLDDSIAIVDRSGRIDDESRRVLALAAQLPDTYREPLMLKAVHGLRSRQIACILGIPEATVDTRVSRARRMLREQAQTLEESPGPSGPLTFNCISPA